MPPLIFEALISKPARRRLIHLQVVRPVGLARAGDLKISLQGVGVRLNPPLTTKSRESREGRPGEGSRALCPAVSTPGEPLPGPAPDGRAWPLAQRRAREVRARRASLGRGGPRLDDEKAAAAARRASLGRGRPRLDGMNFSRKLPRRAETPGSASLPSSGRWISGPRERRLGAVGSAVLVQDPSAPGRPRCSAKPSEAVAAFPAPSPS